MANLIKKPSFSYNTVEDEDRTRPLQVLIGKLKDEAKACLNIEEIEERKRPIGTQEQLECI